VFLPETRRDASIQVVDQDIQVRMPAPGNTEQFVLVRQAVMGQYEQHFITLLTLFEDHF
jgi:hypothetical protein